MVLLRANRNAPWEYKWSSVALIDVPEESRKIVAPSANFHATFSKCTDRSNQKKYAYALWAILNHPIASLWFHERQRVQSIPTPNYRNFPLPKNWNEKVINLIASKSESLVEVGRNWMKSSTLFVSPNNSIFFDLVNSLDNLIFKAYRIDQEERERIESWLGEEIRPYFRDFHQTRSKTTQSYRKNRSVSIDHEWETTFEILELNYKENKIKLVIDGLVSPSEENRADEGGLWFDILPCMPGWIFEKGTIGWIELSTDNIKLLQQNPENYIISFRLHKNAYKTEKEINDRFLPSSVNRTVVQVDG